MNCYIIEGVPQRKQINPQRTTKHIQTSTNTPLYRYRAYPYLPPPPDQRRSSRVHQPPDVVRVGRLEHLIGANVRSVQHFVVYVVQKVAQKVGRFHRHVLQRFHVLANDFQRPLQVPILLLGRLERGTVLLLF